VTVVALAGRDVAVAALVLAVGLAAPAPALGQNAEARRHFDLGIAAARSGAYRDAVAEFTRAYEISPNFAVLYNIATAQAALGDAAAALATFERYLADGGGAIPAGRRAKVGDEVRRLSARTGLVVVRGLPGGARLTLDGADLAAVAAAGGSVAPVRVNQGLHKLAAAHERYLPSEQTVMVVGGQTVELTLALAPLPESPAPSSEPPRPAAALTLLTAQPSASAAAPPPPPPLVESHPIAPGPDRPARSSMRTAGYVTAGAGVLALATAGALYLRARVQAQNAIDDGCRADGCQGTAKSEWQSAQNSVTASRIAAAAGGVLLVGGTALVTFAPSPTARPAGIALLGRW
jgi:hypothetical protein